MKKNVSPSNHLPDHLVTEVTDHKTHDAVSSLLSCLSWIHPLPHQLLGKVGLERTECSETLTSDVHLHVTPGIVIVTKQKNCTFSDQE